MKILALTGIMVACLAVSAFAQSGQEAAIRKVLDDQAAAWNAGRLEEFMTGYWKSPKVTFFSGGHKQMGYEAVLQRYRKTYQSEGKEMGKLAFSNLEITILGPAAAFARGRYELTLSSGKKLGGIYTLVFRHFGKTGWKIIHDHTSADE